MKIKKIITFFNLLIIIFCLFSCNTVEKEKSGEISSDSEYDGGYILIEQEALRIVKDLFPDNDNKQFTIVGQRMLGKHEAYTVHVYTISNSSSPNPTINTVGWYFIDMYTSEIYRGKSEDDPNPVLINET